MASVLSWLRKGAAVGVVIVLSTSWVLTTPADIGNPAPGARCQHRERRAGFGSQTAATLFARALAATDSITAASASATASSENSTASYAYSSAMSAATSVSFDLECPDALVHVGPHLVSGALQ